VERGSGVPNLVTWGMQSHKECHNCIFKSRIHVSDTSAHIDYYTAWLTKVKMSTVFWESWKQAARQTFTYAWADCPTYIYIYV